LAPSEGTHADRRQQRERSQLVGREAQHGRKHVAHPRRGVEAAAELEAEGEVQEAVECLWVGIVERRVHRRANGQVQIHGGRRRDQGSDAGDDQTPPAQDRPAANGQQEQRDARRQQQRQ
jgi:hypothetical protein